MNPPRDRRELEEWMQARFLEMLPRALEVATELADSPNKRTAAKARKLLARHDAALRSGKLRSGKEQEGTRTRAAS
jgi:hypothetical protein